MKKIVLNTLVLSLTVCLRVSAQYVFPLFQEGDSLPISGKITAFDGAKFFYDTMQVQEIDSVFLQIMASDTGKYGGGVIITDTTKNSLGYEGTVANTTFQMLLFRNDVATSLTVLFNTTSSQFGYTWDLQDSSFYSSQDKDPILLSVPLESMGMVRGDTLSTDWVLDSTLSSLLPQIIISLPMTTSDVRINSMRFISNTPLSLSDDLESTGAPITIFPNPCSNTLHFGDKDRKYTFMDSIGNKINEGFGQQLDVSSLEKGMYFILFEKGQRQKVIVN